MNKKYKVGYTTGVFDMFHIEHLKLLKKAKEHCDYLIVGVSTDELVEIYKNKKPIIPLKDRMEILKSVRYVDKVVAQTSMDKVDAWHKYHYDVLFHGADWKNSNMYNEIENKLKPLGVEFIYFDYKPGMSSSLLRSMLLNYKNN